MADGKVTISVDLDGKQAQGGIEKLKGALGGLGSTFKSMLGANLVSGALMGGFTALGGAVKSVFASAIDEGAKLQQSLGGIDTLFKDSADTVKNYASNAYKTAGLSANAYMENVTSFSASLISSLGGDTAAAAELANRAMTDMSDNANKMGTDMQAITGTYQSLARGNYAMLDNLKLGYGGTKAEMKRLIKDASSYKDIQDELGISVEEGNMSFANMVKAISVVQKKLDITGTTMKEASTTFSGSLSMMKGAFNDFLGNLTTGGDITKPLQALAESAATFLFGNFIPMIGNVFKGLPTALSSFIEAAKPALVNGLKELLPEEAVNGITKVFDLITYSIDDMVMAFQDFYQGFEKTGAIKALSSALSELLTAGLDLSEKLSGIIPWETIGAAAGHVVKFIAQIIQAVTKFSQSMSGDTWRGIVTGIGGALVAFKAFNFLKSFNPFSFFKKGAEEAIDGATGGIKRAKSTISQVFSGISSVIKTAGNALNSTFQGMGKMFQGMGKMFQGLGKTFEGVGKGIGAALKGLMQGLKGLNPATLLSFGAAVGIAAVGIGAGIGIIAAGFALLATQSQGISTILQAVGGVIVSVGTAIGTILNLALQGLAQALVTVAPVLPTIASAFAMLSPVITAAGAAISMIVSSFSSLAPVITALGTALSQVITAISSGIAQIATAVTPIVAIISNAFVQVVTVVSNAIVQIIQVLAPFIPAITQMVQAVAPVLQSLVEAFNNLISQISPIIDSLTQLLQTFGEQVSSILESAGSVVESFGSAIRNVLDGVAGIFESMGNAAKNAGQGVKLMAQGIKMLVDLKLGDLVATLTATATGLGVMAGHASGMATLGIAMTQIGTGMTMFATGSVVAVTAMTTFGTAITVLQTSLAQLPALMTTSAAGFSSFTAQAVAGVAGLSAINAPIAMFKSQIMTITPALMMASVGFASFSAQVVVVGGVLSGLGGRVTMLGTALVVVSAGFAQVSSSASNASGQVTKMASSTQVVISAFNSMRSQVQSSMQATLNVVKSVGNQMRSEGRQTGQQTAQNIAQGIRGGVGKSTSAMQALMNAVRSVGMAGVGSMQSVGAMIGQGLAQGMMSALGSVTAAANALVAQAERAAKAKAQIHSPSRLFRDAIGRFLPMGVAVGIEKNTKYVDKAMDGMYEHINAFNYKAEDVIGVGKTKLSKVVQVKSDLESAIKATVEVAKGKSNELLAKALDVAEKAVERPAEMRLDDGTLVAKTGHKFSSYQSEQLRRENRMKGIIT